MEPALSWEPFSQLSPEHPVMEPAMSWEPFSQLSSEHPRYWPSMQGALADAGNLLTCRDSEMRSNKGSLS